MSDRYKGLTVTLDADYGEEQTKAIVEAIEMIKGVAHVEAKHVADTEDHMARQRVRHELAGEMFKVYDQVVGEVPMMKRNLEATVRRARGTYPLLLARIPEMTEAEAEQWLRLIRSVEDDATRDGERKGAREPWRHGGFVR